MLTIILLTVRFQPLWYVLINKACKESCHLYDCPKHFILFHDFDYTRAQKVPQLGYCSSYGAITWLHRAPHVILHQVVQFSSSYIKKG